MAEEIIVSFSGGETSAYMAWLLHQEPQFNCHFVFANTGQEDVRTLDFIKACDDAWGLGVIWLEAVPHYGQRKACTHKIVNYNSADRCGRVFADMITKYGIPNQAYPHCTRELKLHPIRSWMRSLGLIKAKTAVGIRYDEIDRQALNAKKMGIFYPLIESKVTKRDVKQFWHKQNFSLGLEEHEGNCMWCWKKSERKLLTLAQNRPEIFNFPANMERECGLSGHNIDGTPRTFFRNHQTAKGLLEKASSTDFVPFTEPHYFNPDIDVGGGCGESCEVYADTVPYQMDLLDMLLSTGS